MTRFRKRFFGIAGVSSLGLLAAAPAWAAWQTGVSYGGNLPMDLYVPATPATPAPIVVALHYCSGKSTDAHSWFQSYADQFGFIVIAPSAGGNCFDATPTRSGERDAISKMVAYAVTQKKADAARVFVAGASSGACMTEALLAAYPEVFAAGSALAGVPAGAWTGGNAYGWSTPSGDSAQQWGDRVRQADPGFTGTRPRFQLWQGMGDTTLTYSQNYPAEVAQWTNVFAVTDADATTESIKPMGAQDTWARTSYKNSAGLVVVEANSGPSNVPHDLTGRGLFGDVVRFFGLDKAPGGTGGASGTGGATGTGGVTATGGAPATGGMTATGGAPATGGVPATGGRPATGGSSVTGGASGAGGMATSGTGGKPTGGNGGAGGVASGGNGNGNGASTGGNGGAGGRPRSGDTGGAMGDAGTGSGGATASGDGGPGLPPTEHPRGLYEGSPCSVTGHPEDAGLATAVLAGALLMAARRRSERSRRRS